MKAKLKIKNIGGFKEEKNFEFTRGKINQVEAANAMGKTTLTRSLASVLSFPIMHPQIIRESKNQGILRDSLLNIYEKDGYVELEYDGKKERIVMRKDSPYPEGPKNGDERFILSGMLTQEAKSIRQLIEGNADYSWIPKYLSRADRYAYFKDMIESEINESDIETSRIELNEKELLAQNEIITMIKKERGNLIKDRDKLGERLDETKRKHIEKMKDFDHELEKISEDAIFSQEIIKSLNSDMERKKKKKEKLEEELRDINKQIDEFDIAPVEKEAHKNISKIEKKIDEKRRGISEFTTIRDTFEDAISVFSQRGIEKGTCPVCEKTEITAKQINSRLQEMEKKIEGIEEKIHILSSTREDWRQKIVKEQRHAEDLESTKKEKEYNIRELKNLLEFKEKELEDKKSDLAKLNKKENVIIGERKVIDKETDSWEKESHEALKNIEEKLNKVNPRLEDETRKIQQSSFTLFKENKVTLQQAKSHWHKYKDMLSNIKEYLGQKQHEHEEKAITDFNKTVKKVMAEIGFSEFDQIALDRNTKELKVIRPGFKLQTLESLCTTEKYSIAILLQIALKKTYLPHIPFFIVDEIFINYDKDKKKKVTEYLERMAKEQNLFVIITRLPEKPFQDIRVV